jgi:molybdate transport system ATP-binding protein
MIDVDIEQTLGRFELKVSFRAEARIVGLFGRSGSGKTTVVNAIAGVSRPVRGRIAINDAVLFDSARGIDVAPQKRRLGYVFQDDLLFPHLDVQRNLMYGARLAPMPHSIVPERVIELLGLGALLRQYPGTLSGGERQRVSIGRALLAQPRLLLMDEPLASLDVPRRNEVLSYIEMLRDELAIPIVYVSHSVAEITRLADTLVVISDGRCIASGDVEAVMGRPDLRPHTGRYEAGAVIETHVLSHDLEFGLATLAFDGGTLVVPSADSLIGERVRARIRARDVSLALTRPDGISIQNILQATIDSLPETLTAIVDVQLKVGKASLTARITRESLHRLRLERGQPVYALVKAVALDRRSVGYA